MTDFATFAKDIIDELMKEGKKRIQLPITCRNYVRSINKPQKEALYRNKTFFAW